MKNILFKISKRIEEQSKLYVRGHKGGGTGHAYTNRRPTNLGSSLFDTDEETDSADIETGPIKVSRAFKK